MATTVLNPDTTDQTASVEMPHARTPRLSGRIRYAVRYVRHGEMPPKANEAAWCIYWLTLGRTGDFAAASAARDAEIRRAGAR